MTSGLMIDKTWRIGGGDGESCGVQNKTTETVNSMAQHQAVRKVMKWIYRPISI